MAKEYDFFLENLSMLLRSSLPIREAIATLKQEVHGKQLLKKITIVENEIESGSRLSTALKKSGLLAERFIDLLQLGEETGELQKQFKLIIEEKRKEDKMSSKIKGALIYPAIVLIIALSVGIFSMWYIFPKITAVFTSAGGTLPASTRAIIAIGNFFTSYGVVFVPILFVAIASIIYFLFLYKNTRFIGETLLLKFPISKTIIQEMELARFGYITGSLLHAGITLPQVFKSMIGSTRFVLYKGFYSTILQDVVDGNSLYKSIRKYPHYQTFIPSYIAQLIYAGELSGSLSETMLDIGATYEAKSEELAQNLSILLEPIIIVVVGIFVAFLAMAIISPIYGLTQQIN